MGEWERDDSEIDRVKGRLRKWEWWESKTFFDTDERVRLSGSNFEKVC